ncbi:MAG: aldehyde ferredoxin oxidoreductase [Syntrophobacterales bacterium]|nr:aldehyde ferredoxin oxidoreductase [Syntrophobacterales bacterium]
MIRDTFRVLWVDLATGKGRVEELPGREEVLGGSGLAARLFEQYGRPELPWNHPEQPLIFTIGPLTGYFPLMSKTVAGFKSPYHDQYAESHAGGRSALALRFADLDALVVSGRAPRPSVLGVGSRHLEVREAHYLWGRDVLAVGKYLRRMFSGAGHRSILRIGPAGEQGCAYACINVDTYRHFGRLGGGAVMGAKHLKAIVIQGDATFPLPEGKEYAALFERVFRLLTDTPMMQKYHNLGTPANIRVLNDLKALPWRNLTATSDPRAEEISGERFAEAVLLRNTACAGCPVGCIHLGFVREKFRAENRYFFRQIGYDHEPIYAMGSMLGVTDAFQVLRLIETTDRLGLDVMSAGVALAWAVEAWERGLLTESDTLLPLGFGDVPALEQALHHLARGATDFYRLLAQGTAKAAAVYGGGDFACVLGQEMAGYATGEVFFVSQALGFRHSHLDAAGYSFDQKARERRVEEALDYLLAEERQRVILTSLVACLFAREVYRPELVAECLAVLGYGELAARLGEVGEAIQRRRWRLKLATGYDPDRVEIPRRLLEVENWKGKVDADFMTALKAAYARVIRELGRPAQG